MRRGACHRSSENRSGRSTFAREKSGELRWTPFAGNLSEGWWTRTAPVGTASRFGYAESRRFDFPLSSDGQAMLILESSCAEVVTGTAGCRAADRRWSDTIQRLFDSARLFDELRVGDVVSIDQVIQSDRGPDEARFVMVAGCTGGACLMKRHAIRLHANRRRGIKRTNYERPAGIRTMDWTSICRLPSRI